MELGPQEKYIFGLHRPPSHIKTLDWWVPNLGSRCNEQLVVEDVLAADSNDFFLLCVDRENSSAQFVVDVCFFEILFRPECPFRGVTRGNSFRE